MSEAHRASALDIRWGRGGGRRQMQHPGGLIVELDELRREREAMPVEDPQCLELGCLLKRSEHLPPCRVCGRLVEHHSEDACWEGKASMALARLEAGSPLNDVDRMALDRFPHPRSAWERTS